MENSFSLETVGKPYPSEMKELDACNDFTAKYGLVLSDKQIALLEERRFEALKANGRIEFGEGIIKKLVYAFCDSPNVQQQTWEDTLTELQDAFYYFKNESDDRLTDDELIEYMKKTFDGAAQGSIEYLLGTSLEELCRNARGGFADGDGGARYDR